MNAAIARATPDDMSLEEFNEFVKSRPDWEKWELIEGEPVLNAAPAKPHQIVVANLVQSLANLADELKADWQVTPGLDIPIPVDPPSVPIPDVLIHGPFGVRADAPLVTIEVLSPTTRRRDRRVKPLLYAQVPSIRDIVIIDPLAVEVVHHRRSEAFVPRVLVSLNDILELEAVEARVPLSRIYRRTGVA